MSQADMLGTRVTCVLEGGHADGDELVFDIRSLQHHWTIRTVPPLDVCSAVQSDAAPSPDLGIINYRAVRDATGNPSLDDQGRYHFRQEGLR